MHSNVKYLDSKARCQGEDRGNGPDGSYRIVICETMNKQNKQKSLLKQLLFIKLPKKNSQAVSPGSHTIAPATTVNVDAPVCTITIQKPHCYTDSGHTKHVCVSLQSGKVFVIIHGQYKLQYNILCSTVIIKGV